MEQLRQQLRDHNYRYYFRWSSISDSEYDQLSTIKRLEKDFPALITLIHRHNVGAASKTLRK